MPPPHNHARAEAAEAIRALEVPEPLRRLAAGPWTSEAELVAFEDALMEFFNPRYALFNPYPTYFRTRTYELRLLRHLAPRLLDPAHRYRAGVELGCAFGFRSMLLMPYCDQLTGFDIPAHYAGCVQAAFDTSVDVASLLVNQKFGVSRVRFEPRWPTETGLADGAADFVYSEYLLEHAPDLPAVLRECARILAPGGRMVHVVANTTDTTLQFIDANIRSSPATLLELGRSLVAKHVLRRSRSAMQIRPNGTVVPRCHSEFLGAFSQQIELYRIENTLFPILEAGFHIEQVLSTREHNNVILARKLDRR